MFLRRLKKSKSLRFVNLLGLTIVFVCLILSYAYIKRELSYDRFHSNADRIVRYSIQYDNEPVDVRIYGFTDSDPTIANVSGIEAVVRMHKLNMGEFISDDKIHLVNNCYLVSSNFFEVFDFKLLEGDRSSVLDAPEKVVISKNYARQLFGEESPVGKELQIVGNFKIENKKVYISGVFEDIPETSHFHTDLLIHLPDTQSNFFLYTYLLLYPQTNLSELNQAIAANLDELSKDDVSKASPYLFPLTDIHLHSHQQREHEPNGHIYYVYLVVAANLLLLLIVLFNLWLNAGLIFFFNRRYYQLLRLNGASSFVVLRDETLFALILGCVSMIMGGCLAWLISPGLLWNVCMCMYGSMLLLLGLLFLLLVTIASIIPVITRMPSTLFLTTQTNLREFGFTLSSVKYMLIGQYGMVIFIMIISFFITKQIGIIRASQIGGEERTILVLNEQPSAVIERYELLKTELMKYPEIRMVTSAMQLPGSAIRDRIGVWKEGETSADNRIIPLLVVGNDFLPFFNIQLIAGRVFQHNNRSSEKEIEMMLQFHQGKGAQNMTEEYIINRKVATLLGFDSPEEAIGKHLYFSHGTLDYINNANHGLDALFLSRQGQNGGRKEH